MDATPQASSCGRRAKASSYIASEGFLGAPEQFGANLPCEPLTNLRCTGLSPALSAVEIPGSESTAWAETEASWHLRDPPPSWSATRAEYVDRMAKPERQMRRWKSGLANSTPSAGKPRTWGRGGVSGSGKHSLHSEVRTRVCESREPDRLHPAYDRLVRSISNGRDDRTRRTNNSVRPG
jgi:hypothetical protein